MQDPYAETFQRRKVFVDQLRTRARRVHLPLEEQNASEPSVSERIADQRPGPEEECRQSELSRRLYHCQTRLSRTLRLAFQLRDVEGLSIRETARILRVPHGRVKAQSTRARKKLRELIRRGFVRDLPIRPHRLLYSGAWRPQ